jgi:hypothetical protein
VSGFEKLTALWVEAFEAQPGIRLERGLSDLEVDAAEAAYQLRFPPDLRACLQTALPLAPDTGPEKRALVPNWRDLTDPAIVIRLSWPWEGIVFDLEHGSHGGWVDAWARGLSRWQVGSGLRAANTRKPRAWFRSTATGTFPGHHAGQATPCFRCTSWTSFTTEPTWGRICGPSLCKLPGVIGPNLDELSSGRMLSTTTTRSRPRRARSWRRPSLCSRGDRGGRGRCGPGSAVQKSNISAIGSSKPETTSSPLRVSA